MHALAGANARKVFIDLATREKLKTAAAQEGLWARVCLEFLFSWLEEGRDFRLPPESIDFQRGVVSLGTRKNGDAREATLRSAMRVLLQAAVAGKKPCEHVFPLSDYRWAWRRICKAAGFKAGVKEVESLRTMRGDSQHETSEPLVFRRRSS